MRLMQVAGPILALSLGFASPLWAGANVPSSSANDVRTTDSAKPDTGAPREPDTRDPAPDKKPDERADDPGKSKDDPTSRQTQEDRGLLRVLQGLPGDTRTAASADPGERTVAAGTTSERACSWA